MPMRILITGGAGFIGSHLARRLAQGGHSVTILDSFLPQVHGDKPDISISSCEIIRADVRDAAAVACAMAGVDVVHHLAAETGVGQSQYEIGRYVSTNTYGTSVVLEAAVAARVEQVVIASSRAVYGEGQHNCPHCRVTVSAGERRAVDMDAGRWDILCPNCNGPMNALPMKEDTPAAPSSIYGITKLQQEQLALSVSRTHKLPVTILRFFNVFGPGQALGNPYVGVLGTFFRRALAKETAEVYEDGEMLRDFVFVEDVVNALVLSTGNERAFGETFNVGTGIAVNLKNVATYMFQALATEPQLVVSGRYRLGDVRHTVADMSRLSSVLDFRPPMSFQQGLKLYVEWALTQPEHVIDTRADEQLLERNLLRQGGR